MPRAKEIFRVPKVRQLWSNISLSVYCLRVSRGRVVAMTFFSDIRLA